MLRNFSFVIKNQLAGCALPGYWDDLEEDLSDMRREGIGAIVTLTEYSLDAKTVRNAGMAYLHLPIEDFGPPTIEQIREFCEFCRQQIEERHTAVVAHCYAGRGRTGTLLACYFVYKGHSAAEALSIVRRLRPGSVESDEQSLAIEEWEQTLRNERENRPARKPRKSAKKPQTPRPRKPGKKTRDS